MTASSRRVGAETSKSRDVLLDSVERLMLTVKRAMRGVTYRAVAAKAGVTASLVQYYFPTLDDIFIAAIRRSTERNLARDLAGRCRSSLTNRCASCGSTALMRRRAP